ncbi:hypothetical protein CJD35_06430 [Sphingobium xenophagum]|uniref:Uncharacterized protein n=1 Tax=Sphingobium xenophagum TaxID=121428 RepID=A0A249MRZ2_SPHXE|nr:hypothetical protein CJD35_06430 [Sphingobium xenophagum]
MAVDNMRSPILSAIRPHKIMKAATMPNAIMARKLVFSGSESEGSKNLRPPDRQGVAEAALRRSPAIQITC